jgi:hypothetical protein
LCEYDLSKVLQPFSDSASPDFAAKVKLKGRARKVARNAAKENLELTPSAYGHNTHHTKEIPVKKVLPLAQNVACKNPRPSVQAEGFRTCRRAITIRRECALWWQSVLDAVRHEKTNSGHSHFIKMLEQVLDVLLPCARTYNTSARAETPIEPQNEVESSDKLRNRFLVLSVEETTEEKDLEILTMTNNLHTRTPKIKYEIEDLEDDEDDRS